MGFLEEKIYLQRPEDEQQLARKEPERRTFQSEGRQVPRPWARYRGRRVWGREGGGGRRLAGTCCHWELGLRTRRLAPTSSLTRGNEPTGWAPLPFLLYP